MKKISAPSFPIQIFIAGDWKSIYKVCREYCNEVGFCVSMYDTLYKYTGGAENGATIQLINYPRFPLSPSELWEHAEKLAKLIRIEAKQDSYTIQSPIETVFYSHREEDNG